MKITENKIKQIIKEEMELMELDLDPNYLANIDLTPLLLLPGMVAVLYATFFGKKPSSDEEALEAVRDHIHRKVAEADAGDEIYNRLPKPPGSPGQGDMQSIKNKARLKKLRQQYGKSTKDI